MVVVVVVDVIATRIEEDYCWWAVTGIIRKM